MEEIFLWIFSLGALLFFSGFFSGSETAFFSLEEYKLLRSPSSYKRRLEKIRSLRREPEKFLMAILLGNLFINILFSDVGYRFFHVLFPYWEETKLAFYSLVILTSSLLLGGEVFPKMFALKYNLRWILGGFPFLYLWIKGVSYFLMPVYRSLVHILEKIFPERKVEEKELILSLDVLPEGQRKKLLKSLIRFYYDNAYSCMIPKGETLIFSHEESVDKIIDTLKKNKKTFGLLVKEEEIQGAFRLQELFLAKKQKKGIEDYLLPVFFVPESMPAWEILRLFLEEKKEFVIVLNEEGSFSGVITLKWLLKKLLGYWEEEVGERKVYIKKHGDRYLVLGDTPVDVFVDFFGISLETKAERISGWIMEYLDGFPDKSTRFSYQGLIFKDFSLSPRKIDSFWVEKEK